MKQIKSLSIAAVLTILTFSAVLYTSCHKDKCAGYVCHNGGFCSGGSCSCPSGYSGLHCELSSLIYQNNTFTPIEITVNGSSATIPVGGNVTYVGAAGAAADVSATTSGSYGLVISWSFSDVFPTGGSIPIEPMDVSNQYFYLEMQNLYTSYISSITTNYNFNPYQMYEVISIPNDHLTYGIGYYDATNSTSVKVNFTDNTFVTTSYLNIPNENNAYYVLSVN